MDGWIIGLLYFLIKFVEIGHFTLVRFNPIGLRDDDIQKKYFYTFNTQTNDDLLNNQFHIKISTHYNQLGFNCSLHSNFVKIHANTPSLQYMY